MKLNNLSFSNILKKSFVSEKQPTIAVAVSGGPDSMALLFLLNVWIKNNKGKIIALIVNHNLRKNSLAEARSVSTYITKKNIKSKIINIRKDKVSKRSMTEARTNRYNALTKYCSNKNILHLFLGHQKDDNIETYVNRKLSGSDFEGLKSISANIVFDKINIIRPLLKFTKKEIYTYNKKNKVFFVEDETNTNLNYTRAVIRKFIQKSERKLVNNIEKDFRKIDNNYAFYKILTSRILILNAYYIDKKIIKLHFDTFVNFDKLLIERVIKNLYSFLLGNNLNLRSKKIQLLLNLMQKRNFIFFILGGMKIEKEEKSLIFSKK